ncbi:unnamed protein product [Kluyveromyces dobzhanskii CBS 2104]|uniref:WGS project CCBQ000000000 data, contig 00017 n=1 Tax=Kluyveromyces dobzhanskii CBS 2104 TaxID=1427455 RepID=A0A0A8L8J4_9SACH|nr:unnamed protein product [Kluyveromyces dobzhanskii CBS 2104]
MARKLKGKTASKGLKGALLNHLANEEKAKQMKKREKHIAGRGKPTKQPLRQKEQQMNIGSGFVPFTSDSTLLLVGEGDFSFAKSIIEQQCILPENLIISSYDSGITELKLKYPNSFEENYDFLKENGVVMLFGIDATNMIKSMKLSKKSPWLKLVGNSWAMKKLEFILFNFPHTGRGVKDQDRNILEHQQLVHKYFTSCKELFKLVNNSQKILGSRATMGGYLTNESSSVDTEGYGKVGLSVFSGEPYDSWQIKILAKDNGWKVEKSAKFDWSKFPGYHHKRTNSEMDTTKPAEEREARMYVFEMYNKRKHSKKPVKNDSDDE